MKIRKDGVLETQATRELISTNGSITAIAAVGSDTQLIASNLNRKELLIFNDSTIVLLVGLSSSTVSTSNFTYSIAASTLWTLPHGYTGEVRGIWLSVSPSGFARITELT